MMFIQLGKYTFNLSQVKNIVVEDGSIYINVGDIESGSLKYVMVDIEYVEKLDKALNEYNQLFIHSMGGTLENEEAE